eukprot:1147678-Pelagomonas_calceolata.AAC.3
MQRVEARLKGRVQRIWHSSCSCCCCWGWQGAVVQCGRRNAWACGRAAAHAWGCPAAAAAKCVVTNQQHQDM